MKPNDILGFNEKSNPYFRGYTDSIKQFNSYRDTDCVIAYRKCFIGCAILIKGKREFFAFLIINKEADNYDAAQLSRKSLIDIQKLFGFDDANKTIIVNDELYKVYERKILYGGLMQ